MMKHKRHLLLIAACLLVATGKTVEARVTRFVIEQRTSVAGGMKWGPAGAYEKLTGTAFMEVDPLDPLNAVIVNLDKAARNSRGRVEFSSPFVILKPLDPALGNRKIWFGLNNRGNCLELGLRAFPAPAQSTCNPGSIWQIGANNLLLQQGFTWVDAGWHGDGVMPPDRRYLFPSFPVAKQPDGSPIVGVNRLEFQTSSPAFTLPFVQGFRGYPVADPRTSRATLTMRERPDGPRTEIQPDRWAFATCAGGAEAQKPSRTDVCLFDGFQPDRIYELIYLAQDPIVMGLAYAVTRDIGAFLRHRTHDEVGNRNPLAHGAESGVRRAYLSGTSSTGMYLREFLYLGFNEDEAHRKVFDGVTIYSAGSHRLFANVQFASPTFYSGQDQHQDYTSNAVAPFTFAVTRDPVSGIEDGILKRPATDPHVLQVDEELVFWQWKASLNVVDGAGRPLPVPDNVRLYHQNGWGHISAAGLMAPPRRDVECVHPGNTVSVIGTTPRALMKVLDEWVDQGIEPPPSRYPMLQDGTLVSLAEYRSLFPEIPGLEPPTVMNELTTLDFGPDFGPAGGVQSLHPPRAAGIGLHYELLVPRPGPDGHAVAGIDTLWTRAPLGSNVGWNVRAGARAPDLCRLTGAYAPFAGARSERIASGDSRLSLQERYRNHRGYVSAVKQAAAQLVQERFLLPEDARLLVTAAQKSDVLRAR